VGFAGVQDYRLANPLLLYLLGPRQVPQASVEIFLELSVPNVIAHAVKYSRSASRRQALFCNEFE